jgi:hypothetical protein
MTSRQPASSLPQQPATAAQALAEAAEAAARAWSRNLDPARHSLAESQLYATLRDLGIATRGLAAFQAAGTQPGPESAAFPQHVAASARWLLNAGQSLEGVLPVEEIGPSADPAEPGAALRQAARNTLLAWRQPTGTAADRDAITNWFITAIGFLSAAVLNLAAHAPRRRATDLQAVGAGLGEAIAHLTTAIQRPADDAPGDSTGPARRTGCLE